MKIKHASFRDAVSLAGTNNSIGVDMAKFKAHGLEMEFKNNVLSVVCDKGKVVVPASNIVYMVPIDE